MEILERICCGKSTCCDGLPISVSTNNSNNNPPWMVTQNLDDNIASVNFYTIDVGEQPPPPSNYRRQIPGLQHLGRIRIQGSCHGWMILSELKRNVMWSLWNPSTSKLIRLPPLLAAAHDGQDDSDVMMIASGCLSSPPGDPTSILLLTRLGKPNFVFCRLVKRSRWTEMSYAKQLKRLMGGEEEEEEEGRLDCLTCCNGKVYALLHVTSSVVQIDIKVVKDKQVVISILPFLKYPYPYLPTTIPDFYVLKGCGTELFAITVRLDAPAPAPAPPAGVHLFKLDMTTPTTHHKWEEIHDLKDAVFFVDLFNIVPVSYIPAVASSGGLGGGGYVHVRDDHKWMTINSFHVKDKTLLVLPMPCLVKAIQVSMWKEYSRRGLEAAGNDRRQVKCTNDQKQEEEEEDMEENDDPMMRSSNTDHEESRLLEVPFHVLEMISEHCVGIEYLNLRATCKRCHLAAPRIHWRRNKTALRKLQKYSLFSPWLMVVEAAANINGGGGIMNFTDPISGDKYSMKIRLPAGLSLNYDEHNSKSCSKYGWLLFYATGSSGNLGGHQHQLVFFNPFTDDVRKLPPTPPHYLDNLCFSAPPTSDDCMVVGFSTQGRAAYILRYHHHQQLLWRRFDIVDYGGRAPHAFHFPTFHGRHLYALCDKGQLVVFKDMNKSEASFHQPEVVAAAEPPKCPALYLPQYFLMERDQHLLLVIVDKYEGVPQLFQFNDSTKQWNQIQSLDKHAVFIGDATCVCVEAKMTPKMHNKIYFPRLKDGKLIFYSLETSKYHTFDGKLETREEAFGSGCRSLRTTLHLSLHAWIEPTWC